MLAGTNFSFSNKNILDKYFDLETNEMNAGYNK
jgi:hypothetical protein